MKRISKLFLLIAVLLSVALTVGCAGLEEAIVQELSAAVDDALSSGEESFSSASSLEQIPSALESRQSRQDFSSSKKTEGSSKSSSSKEESDPQPVESASSQDKQQMLAEDGSYYSKEEVALYILQYNRLPHNFITKNEARKLGWEGGSVEKFAKGKAIGGDKFGNFEGTLPKKKGRTYQECDIDTNGGKSRGAKRIVFSNDGLIYYTEDHYDSFTLLYGEE